MRRRDLLLRLAKLRSGDTALWNLPPLSPSSSCSSSFSSSCFSSEGPQTRSRAPCKVRRMLPTQPATCSWAAESFPPKYCMVEKLTHSWLLRHQGHHGNWVTGKSSFVWDEGILWVSQKVGSVFFSLSGGREREHVMLCKKFLALHKARYSRSFIWAGSGLSPHILKVQLRRPGTAYYLLSVKK